MLKVFLMLLFVMANVTIIFNRKISVKPLYIFLPMFIIVPICFTIAGLINLWGIPWTNDMRSLGLSTICSSATLTLSCFIKASVRPAVDYVVGFHQRYNQQNINRFPISLFVKHRNKLILGYHTVSAVGLSYMLFAMFFLAEFY